MKVKKPATEKHQWVQKKIPTEAQEQGKGSLTKQDLQTVISLTPAKHHRDINDVLSTHAGQDQAVSLDFHPYEEVRRCPKALAGIARDDQVGSWDLHPL